MSDRRQREPTFDERRIDAFVSKVLADLASAATGALVRLGQAAGLYQAVFDAGTVTVEELAAATATPVPGARAWLAAQVAGGYVERDAEGNRYFLLPEQALVLVDRHSPVFLARLAG